MNGLAHIKTIPGEEATPISEERTLIRKIQPPDELEAEEQDREPVQKRMTVTAILDKDVDQVLAKEEPEPAIRGGIRPVSLETVLARNKAEREERERGL